MSTDKEKTETGGGDSPVLFGPSNDPSLTAKIDKLTGVALEGAIARLGAFSDDVFGDEGDEDPFPDGIRQDESEGSEPASDPVSDETSDGDEDLDLILDKLSEDPSDDSELTTEAAPERALSLQEIARMQDEQTAPPTAQRSPIADVLAGSGMNAEAAEEEGSEYHDPGLPDPEEEAYGPGSSDMDEYDPFGDMDVLSEYDQDPVEDVTGKAPDDLPDETLGEVDEDFDPDFPDDDLFFPDEETETEDDAADDRSDIGYGLPEPTPYGDQDGMGSPYGYEDEPDEAQEVSEPDAREAGPDPEQDMLEDWQMPEEKVTESAEDPVSEPVDTDWSTRTPEESSGQPGSALDDLITGLDSDPQQDAGVDDAGDAEETGRGEDSRPSFLRKGPDGRPISGVLSGGVPAQYVSDDVPEEASAGVPEGDDFSMEDAPVDQDAPEDPEDDLPTEQPAKRSGRKGMLLTVAALALLAAAGAGAYLMKPDLFGAPIVAEAPAGDFVPVPEAPAFIPLPETAEPAVEEALAPPTVEAPAFDTADLQPPATPEPDVSSDPEAVSADPVPADVSDLLAELNREPETPAPAGVSPEELEALTERMEEVEQARLDAERRSDDLTDELTSLTDQITGLLQRDSEQAERLERMERLIRGQSAIMAQFGEMEESLEQTQVVLLDVSARIGAVEGQNPADRDAVNRALADVEERIQALTANMSILARMSIEGVDALRAPNAASGTVGVQTAPAAQDPSGGADPVFRSETGGFRISSDPAGRIPSDVEKDDFIEGYGYVLDVLPASDGQRLVIMENGSVLVPNGD